MRKFWTLAVLGAALATAGGCVVVVGNDLDDEHDSWSDDEPHRMIGITMGSVSDALASQLSIDDDDSTLVLSVKDGMPADRAGMKANDVVVGIDGDDEASPKDMSRAIQRMEPGGELHLRVIRAGQPMEVTVVLDGEKGTSGG